MNPPIPDEFGWDGNMTVSTREPPPILYFYCSVDVFIKIVTGKSLWLTNLFFMNDSQEHFWLRNKARRFIDEQIKRCPDEFGYQYLDTILKQGWRHEIYCSCFSERPDLLSQWRGYGDDGKGVAIGFRTEHLQWLCNKLNGKLSNIIYEEDTQDAIVSRAFDLPPNLSDGEDPTIEEGSTEILGRISEAASRCKNPAFSEEAEWRIVCEPIASFEPPHETIWTKTLAPRYCERRGIITPYMEVPLVEGTRYHKRGSEPILEVYFGPKASTAEQSHAATMMLETNGFKRVRLIQSSATYR